MLSRIRSGSGSSCIGKASGNRTVLIFEARGSHCPPALTGKQQPIRLVQVRVTDENTGAVVFDGLVDLFMSTHPRLADDLVLRQMAVGQTGYTTGSARWPSGNSTYILHYGRTCAGDVVVIENRMAAAHPTGDTWTLSGLRGQLCRQANRTIVTVTDRASAAFQVTLTAQSP